MILSAFRRSSSAFKDAHFWRMLLAGEEGEDEDGGFWWVIEGGAREMVS